MNLPQTQLFIEVFFHWILGASHFQSQYTPSATFFGCWFEVLINRQQCQFQDFSLLSSILCTFSTHEFMLILQLKVEFSLWWERKYWLVRLHSKIHLYLDQKLRQNHGLFRFKAIRKSSLCSFQKQVQCWLHSKFLHFKSQLFILHSKWLCIFSLLLSLSVKAELTNGLDSEMIF